MGPPPGSVAPHPVLEEYYGRQTDRDRFVRGLFDRTAVIYDRVNRILGLGTGTLYRAAALRRAGLRRGQRVLDVATGTGLVARGAARVLRGEGLLVGADPCRQMLGRAGAVATLRRTQAVAERLPYRGESFDLVVLGYALRHLDDLRTAFAELRRVLRPKGTLLVLELGKPASGVGARALKLYMTRIVPLLAGRKDSTDSRALLRYTWDTIDSCVDSATILGALGDTGFADAREVLRVGPLREFVGTR